MPKNLKTLGLLAGVLSICSLGNAQAKPTAVAKGSLQVGGGVSYASPDYGQESIKGVSGFIDFDFTPHLGLEGAVHYIALVTPQDLAENTFLIGPRYVWHKGRFSPYGKLLGGRGDLAIQETQDNPGKYSGNYFAYAFGGGLDIDVTRHIIVRAIDFEYQQWPNLGNGLTPTVITIGAAYRFR
jgi:opacity protein-like surface antigen